MKFSARLISGAGSESWFKRARPHLPAGDAGEGDKTLLCEEGSGCGGEKEGSLGRSTVADANGGCRKPCSSAIHFGVSSECTVVQI